MSSASLAAASDNSSFKTVSDCEAAADREIEALSLQPLEKGADDTVPVEIPLPPSPPLETENPISVLAPDLPADPDSKVENTMQASSSDVSSSDVSDGYATCSDVAADDRQSSAEVSASFFHRAKHHMSAASKYRLRCQCGARNCRQYLYWWQLLFIVFGFCLVIFSFTFNPFSQLHCSLSSSCFQDFSHLCWRCHQTPNLLT